jgi:selenocysteine lyase/cysteine desulfurase
MSNLVANDPFTVSAGETKSNEYQPSVHITNCCANSHDPSKFAGEILADLQSMEARLSKESGETVVALGTFWDSISASVAELARRTSPFLQGGEANNGFEYLGMDFILSYSDGKPVAYLLEVNAPPSQDTATGLAYAEDLHDTVIRDIFSLWVFPKVNGFGAEVPGGWRCVHKEPKRVPLKDARFVAPSKAAILNKIRWALYEQKISRRQEDGLPPPEFRDDEITLHRSSIATAQRVADMSAYARAYFPYFDDRGVSQSRASQQQAFFENAGGTQCPVQVINAVCSSLRCRNRSVIGSSTKAAARDVLRTLLGATHHDIFLGANASSLLSVLAAQYARSGFLTKSDEIVISSENHLANVKPWVQAASTVGAIVKWWNPAVAPIEEVLSSRTRLVAVPHASNILGQILDLTSIRKAVDQGTLGSAHVIVDGVAAVPHCFAAVDEMDVDWYVVSCHKLFGPHLGALCGRLSAVEKIVFRGEKPTDALEIGTVSFEACAGIQGLGEYFGQLSMYSSVRCNQPCFTDGEQETRQVSNESSRDGVLRNSNNEAVESTALRLTTAGVKEAYRLIRLVETPLVGLLLTRLERSTKVRVIETNGVELVSRLPIVSFIHAEIPSSTIVEICNKAGVACRCGTFLCTGLLQNDYGFDYTNDIVRFSLAHYNCSYEVQYAIRVLESLPGWF